MQYGAHFRRIGSICGQFRVGKEAEENQKKRGKKKEDTIEKKLKGEKIKNKRT